MAKEKKITVRFYLVKIQNEEESYNIYCRVTYNRKTTKFPLNHTLSLGSLENAEKKLQRSLKEKGRDALDLSDRLHLNWRKRMIEKIIRFEAERIGENYSVIGLSNRYAIYRNTLQLTLSAKLYEELFKSLQDALSYRQYIDFESYVQPQSRGVFYFTIFHHLEYLADKYNIDVVKVLGGHFYFKVSLIGYFSVFELKRTNKNPEDFMTYGAMPFTSGEIELGEWITNIDDIREKFFEFVNNENPKVLLNEYTKGAYSKAAEKLGFDQKPIDRLMTSIGFHNFWETDLLSDIGI